MMLYEIYPYWFRSPQVRQKIWATCFSKIVEGYEQLDKQKIYFFSMVIPITKVEVEGCSLRITTQKIFFCLVDKCSLIFFFFKKRIVKQYKSKFACIFKTLVDMLKIKCSEPINIINWLRKSTKSNNSWTNIGGSSLISRSLHFFNVFNKIYVNMLTFSEF